MRVLGLKFLCAVSACSRQRHRAHVCTFLLTVSVKNGKKSESMFSYSVSRGVRVCACATMKVSLRVNRVEVEVVY